MSFLLWQTAALDDSDTSVSLASTRRVFGAAEARGLHGRVVAHVVGLDVVFLGQFLNAGLGEIAADGDNVQLGILDHLVQIVVDQAQGIG